MSFRSLPEHRLHLEDAIGAGAVDRLDVRDVEHVCEHEQDDVRRRQERSERLHNVEHFADEDRELDLRALWKMMTPIQSTSFVSTVPLQNTLTLATIGKGRLHHLWPTSFLEGESLPIKDIITI